MHGRQASSWGCSSSERQHSTTSQFSSTTRAGYAQRWPSQRPVKCRIATLDPPVAQPAPNPPPNGGASSPTIITVDGQRVHSLTQQGHEVIMGMSDWAERELLPFLRPVKANWQPADWLPDPSSPDFLDRVATVRTAAAQLPTDYLVVLVGDMVTEEALPSYMNMLNLLDGTRDKTGASPDPWSRWTRGWTAEENRHGDLLNRYLYLSGRVDMRAVETTIQRLIASGFDPQLENNPYLCFIYTSFQERATKISHANTARLASHHGDPLLARICTAIANDEGRHEAAYQKVVSELFRRDPEGAVMAFADMMRKGIVMPAHFMDDGWHRANNPTSRGGLFADYSAVAESAGVYTAGDYAAIVEHLVRRWGIADLRLTGEAANAQEMLCGHAARVRRLADLQLERRLRERRRGTPKSAFFSWVNKREVSLI